MRPESGYEAEPSILQKERGRPVFTMNSEDILTPEAQISH